MKKIKFLYALILALGLIILPAEGKTQVGPGMIGYGPGYGGWVCPYCGQYMGPEAGYGMGPGMMGPGYGYGPQYQQPQKPLTEKDAREMLQDYLQSTRNPNLKMGKITDQGPYYEAEIVTKDNALADKILVDKNTGWMRSLY
jgi:hypothetical protein